MSLLDTMIEKRTYRLTGITELLGSQAASAAVRTEYIASKAPTDELRMEEEMSVKPDLDSKGLTVFMRDEKSNDELFVWDYVMRGFFKGTFDAMKAGINIKQARSKVDKYLFIQPRRIYILKDGERIRDEDDLLERPLRAETMQGPRVTLAASERIDEGWEIEFTVVLVKNSRTNTSSEVSFEAIESALDYGMLQGLGQWRSGGYGRFTWERIDEQCGTKKKSR